MKTLDLPEWAFLDADNHTGNQLKGRDVLLHVRSNTMFEIFPKNKVKLNPDIPNRTFKVNNIFGIDEEFIIAIHYTLSDDVQDLFSKAIQFYAEWMNWNDRNMIQEDKTKLN